MCVDLLMMRTCLCVFFVCFCYETVKVCIPNVRDIIETKSIRMIHLRLGSKQCSVRVMT